jgi:hypothetical protein
MASANKFGRYLAVLGAAVAALALATAAFAQAPPSPPHQFFGDAGSGSGVTVDGEAAADGAAVTAWNEDGVQVGEASVSGGLWLIQVDPDEASTVSFAVDGSSDSGSYPVESGSLTAVTLAVTSGATPPTTTPPDGLPGTGSGGLAGSGSSIPVLPLVLVAAVMMALGGVAVTRRSLS